MKKERSIYFYSGLIAFIFSFLLINLSLPAQNETAKWYFGDFAGLDFMTNPPTILLNSGMQTTEGCSSISDAAGNLLFYTNGQHVWNSSHQIMANGLNIGSGQAIAQSALIAKQPGNSNLYFVFNVDHGNPGLFKYSIVDMSLAAGQGSVTVKAVPIFTTSVEVLSAVKHCNGTDLWIVTYDKQVFGNGVGFCSFLLTAAGINTVAVTSPLAGLTHQSPIKISPQGKKIGMSIFAGIFSSAIIADFDVATGIVSNSLTVGAHGLYGCEFSPDGSKWYLTKGYDIYQYDLCAGSNSAIVNSEVKINSTPVLSAPVQMQLAKNGKIYVATQTSTLAVINSPNSAGTNCNLVNQGQSVAPNASIYGLPNFVVSYFNSPPPPGSFSYAINPTVSCNTASFFPATYTPASCNNVSYTLTGVTWNFGDPNSSNNTSGNYFSTHAFSGAGIYTVSMVRHFSCGGGTDTVRQTVAIDAPVFSVQTTSINCANLGSGTITLSGGALPYSYTWMPVSQNSSVATGLVPGTYTISVSSGGTCFSTYTLYFAPLIPLSGSITASSSLTCNGLNNGIGNISNLSGGSGTQSYLWSNGVNFYSTASTTSLSAGVWSANVTDALTGCQINQTFLISQPPPLVLALSASIPSVCIGSGDIVLTATNSGGTPGYTYTWTNGPPLDTYTVNETTGATYVYTLNSTDVNNCLTSNTIAVDFISNPVLAISDVSICPLAIGTLSVSGASTYLWSNNTTGSFLSDNPVANTQYTVVGSALGCTTSATASIILYSSPLPVFNSNSPVCNGQTLMLFGSGGSSYFWNGPLGFSSNQQTTAVNPASPVYSGVYSLTVTSVEGCTASTNSTLAVNPTPTLSALGSTVCTSQTVQLSANSFTGSTFLWTGPPNFSSNQQNPTITSPVIANTGTYIVKVTSALGCTNTTTALVKVVPPPSLTVALSSHSLCYQAFNGSPNTITLTSSGADSYTLFTPDLIGSLNPNPSASLSAVPPFSTTLTAGAATLTGSNGICTAFTTFTFNIIPNPTVSINHYTPVICAGNNFTYTSQGADSYTWGPNSPGLTTYTSAVTIAHPSITTIYSVVGGSMGCNSPAQTSTLSVYPLPTITTSPLSPTVCLNEKIQLYAGGSGTSYEWFSPHDINNATGPSVFASPKVTQVYTVVASANNCTASAKITVTVLELPQPTITISKAEVCVNETITLQGSGGVSYDWFVPGDFYYQGEKVSFKVGPGLAGSSAGLYTLTVTDLRGCKNSTTTLVKVNSLPDGSLLGLIEEGCVPLCSEYNFAAIGSKSVTSTWQINNQVYQDKVKHCFTTPGTYTISGTLYDKQTTCSNKINFNVLVHPRPESDFIYSPLQPVENLDEIIFTNTSLGDEQTKWHWYFNNGYEDEGQQASFKFQNEGFFPVVLVTTNKWNCKDTIIKTIKVEPDLNIYVPNAFTPNGDDRNDIFIPVTTSVKLYTLAIYDRWGQRVFYSTSIDSGWDGTFKGVEIKADVYTWKVTLSTLGGQRKELNGHVSLVR